MQTKWLSYGAFTLVVMVMLINEASGMLKNYQQKRDFSKTPEPPAYAKASAGQGKQSGVNPLFVIQKHAASRLHYDLRLEIDGVLVSWAIPKGPSLNTAEKRLAIRTEDHPIAYAKFEGIIQEGNYGAGTVMVWDIGTYKNIKEKNGKSVSMKQCLKDGRIEIWLEGEKISGGFALVKMERAKKDEWLLIKMKDAEASKKRKPVNTQNKSVLTNRTMHQIKKAGT